MLDGDFVCQSCGRQVRYCGDGRPCERLVGWFMVTQWGGPGTVDNCFFCCADCLRAWVDSRGPGVPDAFLKAFKN